MKKKYIIIGILIVILSLLILAILEEKKQFRYCSDKTKKMNFTIFVMNPIMME